MDLAIETRGLTKHYGDAIVAVDSLDLRVARGEVYGFLGPNGAGKTTTLRMLLGLVRPTCGTATVLGATPGAAGDRHAWHLTRDRYRRPLHSRCRGAAQRAH